MMLNNEVVHASQVQQLLPTVMVNHIKTNDYYYSGVVYLYGDDTLIDTKLNIKYTQEQSTYTGEHSAELVITKLLLSEHIPSSISATDVYVTSTSDAVRNRKFLKELFVMFSQTNSVVIKSLPDKNGRYYAIVKYKNYTDTHTAVTMCNNAPINYYGSMITLKCKHAKVK
jgi:hypothetical protein